MSTYPPPVVTVRDVVVPGTADERAFASAVAVARRVIATDPISNGGAHARVDAAPGGGSGVRMPNAAAAGTARSVKQSKASGGRMQISNTPAATDTARRKAGGRNV